MSTEMLKYVIIGTMVLFVAVIIIYLVLRKMMGKSEYARMKKLQEGTKANGFSSDIMYQKLYITFIKIPFIKRYLYRYIERGVRK